MNYQEFCRKYNIHGLNPQQTEAVKRINGATLLLAVPGSGKTTVIVDRTGWMIYGKGIDPKNILTLTYTKMAAGEMKERYIKKFNASRSETPYFSTINAFCLSVIHSCNREKGVDVPELIPNNEKVVRQIAAEMLPEYPTDAQVRTFSQLIGKAKNEMSTLEDIKKVECKDLDFQSLYIKYEEYLRDHNLMDFDDQLVMCNELLDYYPDVLERAQNKYQYIGLDEAQDTSRIQHLIIKKLARNGKGNIFMVGDEDQSIYGFRGAYPQALLSFDKDYEDARVMYMETNYRSDTNIVSASSTFIKGNIDRRDKTMVANSATGGDIVPYFLSDMKDQPRFLLSMVKEQLQKPDETMAVLFRNNDSVIPLIHLLGKEGIQVKSRDASNLFVTHFAVADILDYFRLALNPKDMDIFSRLYFKMGIYINKSVLPQLADMLKTGKYESVMDALQNVQTLRGAHNMIDAVTSGLKRIPTVKPEMGIKIIMDFMRYDASWLSKKIQDGASELSVRMKIHILHMVAQECETAQEFLDAIDKIGDYQGNVRSNVTLSTIHSSKGLEFDKVILIDALEGILPATDGKSKAELEEEARLFYVATTRAKHQLILPLPRSVYNSSLKPSEFLARFFAAGNTGKE